MKRAALLLLLSSGTRETIKNITKSVKRNFPWIFLYLGTYHSISLFLSLLLRYLFSLSLFFFISLLLCYLFFSISIFLSLLLCYLYFSLSFFLSLLLSYLYSSLSISVFSLFVFLSLFLCLYLFLNSLSHINIEYQKIHSDHLLFCHYTSELHKDKNFKQWKHKKEED